MPADRLLTELSLLAAREGDRSARAKAIAEAICAAGPYTWTGINDVDVKKGFVSNVAWSGSGAPQYPTFPVTQG